MPTSRLPLTVPTFTHRYYENMVQFEPGRFRVLAAMLDAMRKSWASFAWRY